MPKLYVIAGPNGAGKTTFAKEFLPHLVILDLMLPGQDGVAVLDTLSKSKELKFTLVLGMTGHNSPEKIKNLMAKGAMSCLVKPFGPEDLNKLLSPYFEGNLIVRKAEEKSSNETVKEKAVNPTGTLVNSTVL